jgi:hypothetical protein
MLYGEGSMGCLKKHYYPEWFKLEQAEGKKKGKKEGSPPKLLLLTRLNLLLPMYCESLLKKVILV